MKHAMKLPDLATTGSVVRIRRWLRACGDPVQRGRPLLEIETDKATMEVEATVDGRLADIRAKAGAEALAGDVIAVIDLPGGPTDAATEAGLAAGGSAPPPATDPAPPPPAAPDAPATDTRASRGTGMFARNRQMAARGASPASAPSPELSLSPMQRTAAQRLQASKQTVPHFYVERSACAEALVARRNARPDLRLLWDAFFVHAVSRALAAFPRMACRFADDRLEPIASDAIGVAVDLRGDLYVVPLAAPVTASVEDLSRDLRAAIEALRAGDPEARRLRPGRITVSNLGSTGVERFSAIVNPPEAAILAIGAIRPVVVPRGDAVAIEPRVTLTLSVDHRVVSGRYAAEFLAAIVDALERP
jgi:pyruvate dehydrogenase E2 component (dihydrolipoamide acetyltransferase)